MAGAKYERGGKSIEDRVRALIKEYHQHLREANIGILWRTTEWYSKGEPVLGDVYMVSGREKYWSSIVEEVELDFLLVINQPKWFELTPAQQTALLDHLLCHCQRGDDKKDGTPTWYKANHDFEGFVAELERHGMWMPNLKRMAETAARKVGEVQQTLQDVAKEQGVDLDAEAGAKVERVGKVLVVHQGGAEAEEARVEDLDAADDEDADAEYAVS